MNPEEEAPENALDDHFGWIPDGGFACPDWQLTGTQILQNAKASKDSGCGCDEWYPSTLALLPIEFFNDLEPYD